MITYLVGREEAEVEGRVGDDVSLGTLGGAGHFLVAQPDQGWLQISQLPGHQGLLLHIIIAPFANIHHS